MKKTLIICAMMVMSVMAYAQDVVKVSPKMKKGDVKVYTSEVTSYISDRVIKMTSEVTYTVVDALADGYVLDVETTKFETDVDASDMVGKLVTYAEEMMKGSAMRFHVDKDGKAMKILNYDEVRGKMEAGLSKFIDELLNTPGMPPVLSKDVLMQQMQDKMTEETLLNSVQKFSSPLMLNGKTITNGTEEEFIHDAMSMKAKRTYTVDGNLISTNTAMDMSKEDIKNFIVTQVEKMMPEQAESIKQNIDMVLNSGMLKMEMDEKATYELQADGWVKSIKGESNVSSMGTTTKSVIAITLK
ncbi:MAG: hypothetical protein J5867_04575 [Prevotella sp.]|nr:hypothetical protein [Prevotella sp.]